MQGCAWGVRRDEKKRRGFLLVSSNFFSTFPLSSFRHTGTHPPHHSAVFHPFPSLSFPLSPSRASSLFGLGIRCRVARPLYSLRPFNSIATLFIRWRMSSEDGRRPCRLERHPSTICQRSTSLIYRRKLVPGIDILFPRIRTVGQFFPLSSAPMRGGDIYRNVWESRR